MEQSNEPESMLTPDEVCTWLKIPKKTLYRWTSDRHRGFPYRRLGKHLRFWRSEIIAYMNKYRSSPGAREFL
jgi:excisionase family DNA binding protein